MSSREAIREAPRDPERLLGLRPRGADARERSSGRDPEPQSAASIVSVGLEDPYDLQDVMEICGTSGACELPLDYNVSTPEVRLVWTFRDSKVEDQFLDYINATNGRGLDVKLNGRVLSRNAITGPLIPFPRMSDYSASYGLGRNCPPFTLKGCLVVVISRRAWFAGPAPWPRWEVRVEDYDLFLDHFDVWNDSGAPCPLPEPGTLAGLMAGGGWLMILNRRRRVGSRL